MYNTIDLVGCQPISEPISQLLRNWPELVYSKKASHGTIETKLETKIHKGDTHDPA